MKLFQKLLVAPAALGLLAPVAASASEMNFDGVSDYTSPSATRISRASNGQRIEGVSQFSEVRQNDWAFTALSSMLERNNCAPISTSVALTRYEAAAILQNCLGNVVEANEEERRLINEFASELAVLNGRVDGIEAGVGSTGSTPGFSSTVVMSGASSFFINANSFDGDDIGNAREQYEATTFTYKTELEFATSFDGDDALVGSFEYGNNNALQLGTGPHDLGFEAATSASTVTVDKLFYSTPWGDDDSLNVTVGPLVGQEDMLGIWPAAYQTDAASTILDVTTLAGAPGAYNYNLGSGFGLTKEFDNGIIASAQYVSTDGSGNAPAKGIFTGDSSSTTTVQLGYAENRWGIAGVYSYLSASNLMGNTTEFLGGKLGDGTCSGSGSSVSCDNGTNAFGLSGYWLPEETGTLMPAISLGFGLNQTDTDVSDNASESQSWMLGLQWDDVGQEGNSAGLAYGTAVYATEMEGGADVDDHNSVFEAWYKVQYSDNIVITPGIYWLDSPVGDDDAGASQDYNQFGAVLRTTFLF